MPTRFSALNSGSNANCYFIGNDDTAILIDAGLSCKETEKRIQRLGIDIQTINALFITHEHHDHVSGLPSLVKKYQWPVYLTKGTLDHLPVPIGMDCARIIGPSEKIEIGSLSIQCFAKHHDAAEPFSVMVSDGKNCIGIMTDIGHCCKTVQHHFALCDAVFLESNYCERMLSEGRYPEALKQRIRGKQGHLSNDQALALFKEHRSNTLQHLILSHLSQNNNTHEIARKTFEQFLGDTCLTIASRYKETALISLNALRGTPKMQTSKKHFPTQLKLF